jgi:hypothetical protein
MVPMAIIKPTFNIDILKMEQAFHMGYREEKMLGFLLFQLLFKKGKEKRFFTSTTNVFCMEWEPPHLGLDALH